MKELKDLLRSCFKTYQGLVTLKILLNIKVDTTKFWDWEM